jgi:uncharacterized membrane protein SpoIIM required for sporulation
MTESAFIRTNIKRWHEFERILSHINEQSPDRLKSLFLQVTDDLAYANTFFPGGEAVSYLHGLAHKSQFTVNKNQARRLDRFRNFWSLELPLISYKHRKTIFHAALIFFLSTFIGAFSSANDPKYALLIMGESYMEMTEQNIANDDPMGVYKKSGRTEMFLGITLNNIRVSFLAFAFGLATAIGTGFLLLTNGLMLGAFQYFFYSKGLFWTSFLTIWIHGTLEISAIVLAGAAGMIMGNSFVFPGTFSRLESFKKGAKEGMKLVVGLVPIFILAGFLEGFVTRLTELPVWLKVFIILFSAIFIIYYFVLYPKKVTKTYAKQELPKD